MRRRSAHVADEAHVEHAVGLVEDEDATCGRGGRGPGGIRSIRRPGVATRMSTPRRSALTCGCWPTPPKMTVWRRRRSARRSERVADLDREFARRRENQRARLYAAPGARGWRKAAGGSAWRRPLSCRCRSGRRRAVLAGEQRGNGLGLDGGRRFVFLRRKSAEDRLGDAERSKRVRQVQSFVCAANHGPARLSCGRLAARFEAPRALGLLMSVREFFGKVRRWLWWPVGPAGRIRAIARNLCAVQHSDETGPVNSARNFISRHSA
jgi:hypothetical protein